MDGHPGLSPSSSTERVVIFDGASGTWLQAHELGPDDFGGEALEGCNEILCDTRPETDAVIPRSPFRAGCRMAALCRMRTLRSGRKA